MIVTGAFQFVSAPIAGALSKRLDLRVMLAIGLSLFGTGVYLQSFETAEWGFWEFSLPQARARHLADAVLHPRSTRWRSAPCRRTS